ncbi:ice-binding family protein [Candidatus Marifrigoribacter sp. Uisw_064]|uniref:ice-binding family protein n=1 Tax=Candidatus Marifrigoribacter sp. Uisw_064 TaxID=3230970 RepID=UPI003D3E7386
MQLILLISTSLYAQVGLGTEDPDPSSALDISSNSKGLLMPRLTTTQRNLIAFPATGLMIYNTTLNDGQLNIGTPSAASWIGLKGPKIDSVNEGDIINTTSNSDLLLQGMTISPESGTYIVSFNAQITALFGSAQGIIDMDRIYQDLMAITATNTTHGLVFGNGESLPPGIYDLAGSVSTAGTLTLDGGGDSNSVFIIRGTGAFTSGAGSTVNLINGASSNNIFWMSEAALSTGANSILKGTLVSPAGAIALGANTNLEGRMLSKAGALSIGVNCVLTAPLGDSYIELRSLSSFAMFTSNGAVTDDETSTITGDIGTALGALTILSTHTGEQYPAGTSATNSTTTTYCIYQNGSEVVNSSRTVNSDSSVVSLQAMVTTLTEGEAIEVRWRVDTGEATLDNRSLSLIRSGY